MNISALLTSAGINIGICALLLFLYSILRKQPSIFGVYFGRKLAQARSRNNYSFCFDRLVPSPSWIVKAWETTEEEILAVGGLDAVVFIRILVFSIRIFSIAAVICVFLVLPLNYYGQEMEHKKIPSESLDVFSIENVKEGSKWLWVHCVALYVISCSACVLLYFEYKSITKMRLAHITGSPPNPSHFAVLVRSIPRSAEESYSESVRKFFTNYHASSYLSHQMVYRNGTVQKLLGDAEKMYKFLKSAAIDQTSKPSLIRCGLCGTTANSFKILSSEAECVKEKAHFGDLDLSASEQVYSFASNRCAQFSNNWKRIATLLDGVANTGMVELGEVQLATYLAEKKPTGRPFFRNGVPSLIAFPPGCKTSDCLIRYHGELSVDAVTDWFATAILSLPRILYYPKESLGQNFLAKSSPHKVKVIFFSKTGERATPFVRQAAKNYWAYASFAFVLWREEESSFWWNTFEIESAPAIVFLKDPGVKPVVHHGSVNNTWFLSIMEQNKQQVLPQLRSLTSMELGCDARGYSRAGYDTMTWYCVILAGRLSLELNKMRETMRRVQEILSNDEKLNRADKDQQSAPSAIALKEKRLTFAWLDGEAQKKYCYFHLHSENSHETCGPRRDVTDVPQLFIVRYKRNATEDTTNVKTKPKSIWDTFQNEDVDPASQLVARYNGSDEIQEIIQWISQIIKDGDSRDLPFFRTKTPELIPEDADPIWSIGSQSILSTSKGMKQRILSFISSIYDRLGDPRIGPILLLAALMSFGRIWLQRSQSTHPSPSNQPSEPSGKDEAKPNRRFRPRTASKKDQSPSITDMEPKDAYQMPLSDSDSD